jgi:hypothetical protein
MRSQGPDISQASKSAKTRVKGRKLAAHLVGILPPEPD